MDIPGTIQVIDDAYFSDAYNGRRFSASLPEGSYTAEFIDENGTQVWPKYAEEYWAKEPDCSGFATGLGRRLSVSHNVTLVKPEVNETDCTELILNGGQGDENGLIITTEPWITTLGRPGNIVVAPALGTNGSDALATKQRVYHWTGPGQNIDSRCLELMKGKYYEINVEMKITHKGNTAAIVQDVNPNGEWWRNRSPIVTLNGMHLFFCLI